MSGPMRRETEKEKLRRDRDAALRWDKLRRRGRELDERERLMHRARITANLGLVKDGFTRRFLASMFGEQIERTRTLGSKRPGAKGKALRKRRRAVGLSRRANR